MHHRNIKEFMRIRIVEESFLELFSQGKLNGTVHTCIGQELSAIAFAGQVNKSDFIFSNHRCHGHFIAYTKDWQGLIAELMGKEKGVSGGIGSSQHLCKYNFFSNGIQGGIMPVSAGFALGNKLKKNDAIGIVFIGDGTLGEGTVYETLNIISKWEIPLLVVCENNRYAQSTPIQENLAGDILKRAEAFGITTKESHTWDAADDFMNSAKDSIDYVRTHQKPLFHLVNTYRLKAHSKGDDDRDAAEIETYLAKDFLEKFKLEDPGYFEKTYSEIKKEVITFIDSISDAPEMHLETYIDTQHPENREETEWEEVIYSGERMVALINKSLHDVLEKHPNAVVLGEDIKDPYGGAFKVTKGLTTHFPSRVFTTPISESAITGISNGLALNGFKPFGEIMFGDFLSLTFDQLLNHASKFYHMYNKQISCPMVIRTPMGGKRGYGPTHSQSIEKHFLGMDMVEIIVPNMLLNPDYIYQYAAGRKHPTVIIENKIDYGKRHVAPKLTNFKVYQSKTELPHILVKPQLAEPTVTFITYGGSVETVLDCLEELFMETDTLAQVLCLSQIDPLPLDLVLEVCKNSDVIVSVEEGSKRGGVGSEIIACLAENLKNVTLKRIASFEYPIPSVRSLEEQILVNRNLILDEVKELI